MRIFYFMGRIFQLMGLLTLPTAIWVTEFQKSESMAIGIFLASVALFFIGWVLAR